MDEFFSPPALARRLGVAERTVYRWIDGGRVPPPTISLGGARGYPPEVVSQIERWYAQRNSQGGKSTGAA